MGERILIPFVADDGGGVDELSWGQLQIWRSMVDSGSSKPIGDFVAMPPGSTVPACVTGLRYVMRRHQSLRTHVLVGEDGVPRQHVATSGEVPLEIIEAGGQDATAIAEQTTLRYHDEPFDYRHEWPIRMAAITRADAVTHVVAVYPHSAIDIHGVAALLDDLASMDPATGEPTRPLTGMTPLQQVVHQRTPAAKRASDAALRYAERLLTSVPANRFPNWYVPRTPRWWRIGMTSPAIYLAGRAIAARAGVRTSPVLLAAFAVAFAETTRTDPAVLELVVHNRFRPGLRDAVGTITQECLGVIDIGDSTFDEIVRRAWQAATRAAKYSYYEPGGMTRLRQRINAERRENVDTNCYFNDRRRVHLNPPPLDRTPTEAELRAAQEQRVVRWERPMTHYDHTVFCSVNDVPDTFDFVMCGDTHRLSPDEMAALVTRMEDVVVTAMLNPDAQVSGGSLSRKPASVRH